MVLNHITSTSHVNVLGLALRWDLSRLLRDVVKIILVKDDLLDLLFWQETWEEILTIQWISLIDILTRSCGQIICVCLHLFLQDQKVHYLMEHSQ